MSTGLCIDAVQELCVRLQICDTLVVLPVSEARGRLLGYILTRLLKVDPEGTRAWLETQARAHLSVDRLQLLASLHPATKVRCCVRCLAPAAVLWAGQPHCAGHAPALGTAGVAEISAV